jgi:SAM-dependent methyltransferase
VGGLGEAALRLQEEPVKLYSELAPWYQLLTHPSDYAEEADHIARLIDAAIDGPARTLLELGTGGGANASYLKRRFACTLTDLSEDMLEVSRGLNPECEHVQGDMRCLRLGRTFDAVLLHDAVVYMTTEDDLRAALVTAAEHLRPGGIVVTMPDTTRDMFEPTTRHGGHDGDGGRSLRYLEWVTDPDPGDSTYETDFVMLLREPEKPLRIEHDHHVGGLFSEATWRRLFNEAGVDVLDDLDVEDPFAGERAVFVARRRA